MPQSLSRVIVHLVFSTKDRVSVLSEEVMPELVAYLVGVLGQHGHVSMRVGGHKDHVHLLFAQSRTSSMSQTVEVLKTSSSKWLKTKHHHLREFHWQFGYGVFSVSERDVQSTIDYIVNQAEHHRVLSFQDELRKLYLEHGIQFNEKYVWE